MLQSTCPYVILVSPVFTLPKFKRETDDTTASLPGKHPGPFGLFFHGAFYQKIKNESHDSRRSSTRGGAPSAPAQYEAKPLEKLAPSRQLKLAITRILVIAASIF